MDNMLKEISVQIPTGGVDVTLATHEKVHGGEKANNFLLRRDVNTANISKTVSHVCDAV